MLLPHFTRAFLIRSVAAWALLRLGIAGVRMMAAPLAEQPPPQDPFALTAGTAILVVATVAAVGWVFARARNEDLFLLNLGYGPMRTVGLAAFAPALLEIAARVAHS